MSALFSPFVDQRSLNLVHTQGSDCSFQRRFPIDDILFSSGDIRDRIAKSEILMFWGRQIFWGRDPQISDLILKITVTTRHVAKFGDDRPRDLRDQATKKGSKRIETSAVKYEGWSISFEPNIFKLKIERFAYFHFSTQSPPLSVHSLYGYWSF